MAAVADEEESDSAAVHGESSTDLDSESLSNHMESGSSSSDRQTQAHHGWLPVGVGGMTLFRSSNQLHKEETANNEKSKDDGTQHEEIQHHSDTKKGWFFGQHGGKTENNETNKEEKKEDQSANADHVAVETTAKPNGEEQTHRWGFLHFEGRKDRPHTSNNEPAKDSSAATQADGSKPPKQESGPKKVAEEHPHGWNVLHFGSKVDHAHAQNEAGGTAADIDVHKQPSHWSFRRHGEKKDSHSNIEQPINATPEVKREDRGTDNAHETSAANHEAAEGHALSRWSFGMPSHKKEHPTEQLVDAKKKESITDYSKENTTKQNVTDQHIGEIIVSHADTAMKPIIEEEHRSSRWSFSLRHKKDHPVQPTVGKPPEDSTACEEGGAAIKNEYEALPSKDVSEVPASEQEFVHQKRVHREHWSLFGKKKKVPPVENKDVQSEKEEPIEEKQKESTTPSLKKKRNFIHSIGDTLDGVLQAMDQVLFPPVENSPQNCTGPIERRFVNGGVLLWNCDTVEEHLEEVKRIVQITGSCEGEEGLRAAGFEYRRVTMGRKENLSPPYDHNKNEAQVAHFQEEEQENEFSEETAAAKVALHLTEASELLGDHPLNVSSTTTRLFHIESNILITPDNRREYISDGPMYEEMARLCQEYAQDMMKKAGSLEWALIECEDDHLHKGRPVRVLLDSAHPLVETAGNKVDATDTPLDPSHNPPTLLILTGKGKVRAGIFSRQHLITTGLELSTALPMVEEATRRNMRIVIVDPNARGDEKGYTTFEESMGAIFSHILPPARDEQKDEDLRSMYILAHSAAGTQLVLYLMDQQERFLPRIRAIAFTDSTHNIQWTKRSPELQRMLESPQCLYLRSSNRQNDDEWSTRKAGDSVETDDFWHRRFGKIRTLWAGTHEHSLTNWFAHTHIWDHFDRHGSAPSPTRSIENEEE